MKRTQGLVLGAWAALALMGPMHAALAQGGADASLSSADDLGIVSLQSRHSVRLTSERLEQGIREQGLKVFARIDHLAQANAVKLALRPTILLVFGDPRSGTLLMHQNQTVGLDLPLKYLIWEAADHTVYVSWNHPAYLARRHGIPPNLALLGQLNQTLTRLAKKAVT